MSASSGPGGAVAFIAFVCEVFGARETPAAHMVDSDDLLIHAEVRVGDSTLMCFDAKPDWSSLPQCCRSTSPTPKLSQTAREP